MTPEEAANILRANYPPENYTMLREAIDFVLAHIDQQAAQIKELSDLLRCKISGIPSEEKDMIIVKQASQIKKLQAALIKERANGLEWLPNRCGERPWEEDANAEAEKQLRAEMPEEMNS